MRKRFLPLFTLLALLVGGGVVFTASPASASGNGYLYLYDNSDYSSPLISRIAPGNWAVGECVNLAGSVNDRTSAVSNQTQVQVIVYKGYNCVGGSLYLDNFNGNNYSFGPFSFLHSWNDLISSYKRTG